MDSQPIELERYVLSRSGKIEIGLGSFTPLQFNQQLPSQYYACFQMNRQLFICGGWDQQKQYLDDLYSSTEEGEVKQLSSMSQKRINVSLCGVNEELLAVAGYYQRDVAKVEKYFTQLNKWTKIAPLNKPRRAPASCLLSNQRAYCFCGIADIGGNLNSI